jgi:hypothetical protein
MFRSPFHDHLQGSSLFLSASTTFQLPASSFVSFGFVAVCPLFICVPAVPVCVLSGRAWSVYGGITNRNLSLECQRDLVLILIGSCQRKCAFGRAVSCTANADAITEEFWLAPKCTKCTKCTSNFTPALHSTELRVYPSQSARRHATRSALCSAVATTLRTARLFGTFVPTCQSTTHLTQDDRILEKYS